MIKKSFEFFRFFNKDVFYNKVAYLWTLVFPLGLLIFNNTEWINNPPTHEIFKQTLYFYLSFVIIISAASGVGVSLMTLRDNGFLKMYSFITGSKLPIVLGKMQSQYFFSFINIILLAGISSIIFRQDITLALLIAISTSVIVSLPIFAFFLFITILPFRHENVAPLFTLLIIGLTYLTNYSSQNILQYLNPLKYVIDVSFLFSNIFENNLVPIHSVLMLIIQSFFFLLIGIVSFSKISVISKSMR